MLGDAMAPRPHQPDDADHGTDLPSLTRKSA
jgi:hypothetical protein